MLSPRLAAQLVFFNIDYRRMNFITHPKQMGVSTQAHSYLRPVD